MKKKALSPTDSYRIGKLVLSAVLAALSILLGKYLALNLGESIRLSFENLPLFIAGFYLGPLAGAAVGIVADLVGCLLVGYSINPIITIGAATIGFFAGIAGRIRINSRMRRVLLTVLPSHILGSVLIKTVGLVVYYKMPFWATLGWRSLTYAIIAVLEIAILLALTGSRAFQLQMEKHFQNRAQ